MGKQSETPGIDTLREHVRILGRLIDDPHPGLVGWREHVYERIQAIKQFGLSPLDHAAPELLAECRDHRMPGYHRGTFADALRSLADVMQPRADDMMPTWLRIKANALDTVIAKAERQPCKT